MSLREVSETVPRTRVASRGDTRPNALPRPHGTRSAPIHIDLIGASPDGPTPMMFAGAYLCKLDEKGRFIVPSPIREQIESDGNAVVFLKGAEESLWIYSTAEWNKILERMQSKLDEDQSRLFMHFVVSEAGTSELDKAGRILIPGRLRKIVPVEEDQEIMLVGLYHRLEVWNPSEWRRYVTRNEDKYEQNLGKILNLL
jgi:MraZ protein